jgi:uncharacterized protein (TIGR03437 family)
VLTVFVTGIGVVSPELASGEPAGSTALHRGAAEVSATLGGVDSPIRFLGLTPGFVGLGQANLQILEGTPTGQIALLFQSGDHRSNAAFVSIR